MNEKLEELKKWLDVTKIGYGNRWINSVAMHCAIRDKILDLMESKEERSNYYEDMLEFTELRKTTPYKFKL